MKLSRLILAGALIACSLACLPKASWAADTNVTVLLVTGSQNGGEVDPALRRYAQRLKSIFNVSSLQLAGRASARIELPGTRQLNLGGGHTVTIDASSAGGSRVTLRTVWRRGDRKMSEVIFRSVSPGQPNVTKAGEFILLVEAR